MIDLHDIGVKTVKAIIFFLNLFFAFTGFLLICIGVVIKEYYDQYEEFIDDKYFSASSLLISTGSIIFIISFFGCCGALKESRCMVLTYSVLLTAILILEFAAGITAYVLTGETSALIEDKLNTTMSKYNSNYDVTVLWDTVQSKFQCCGLNKYTDWSEVFRNDSLPVSCCAYKHGTLDNYTCSRNSPYLYDVSCKERLSTEVADHTMLLGAVAFTTLGCQCLGILLACYLAKVIKKSNYETV